MVLIIRSMVFMVLLTILFLGATQGQQAESNAYNPWVSNDKPYGQESGNKPCGTVIRDTGTATIAVSHTQGTVQTPGVYQACGYKENEEEGENSKNLIIGGILQNSPDPNKNLVYEKLADDNDALYIPTYYSGNLVDDSLEVERAATYNPEPTYQNGLLNDELNDAHYDTIIAYSGGTASAITAIDKQGVTCKTLILVSPIRGDLLPGDYDKMIQSILNKMSVEKIVVLQSQNDTLPLGLLYQAKFTTDKDTYIDVFDVPLTQIDVEGHKEMLTYAEKFIHNGMYESPQAESNAYNPWISKDKPFGQAIDLSRTGATDYPFLQKASESNGLGGWGGQPIGSPGSNKQPGSGIYPSSSSSNSEMEDALEANSRMLRNARSVNDLSPGLRSALGPDAGRVETTQNPQSSL